MHYTSEALAATLHERLTAALAPVRLEITDDSHHHAGHAGARGGGRHYRVLVVSAAFAGKPTVSRHRLVYAAAGELMRGPIHALALTTHTPEEEA
ncbi:BolA family protein/stress-induced morphogen [Oryzomicrobium terrae]|uniref:BolA family protein/stress-induced morphogen n=1 Tax=Oryzomicrobium terrae TaxID=1735038 RepID=A0A5C1E8C0_9RHOO|nr:BolA family protein [Oryzomicrobium terrae]QEL65212.1 BolA family protein/stress-induced morphogen [Oryzomicrobium terrae]